MLGQIRSLTLERGGEVASQHGGNDGVLIAGIRSLEVTAALLKAEDEAVFLVLLLEGEDLTADVLEAREDPAHLHAVS